MLGESETHNSNNQIYSKSFNNIKVNPVQNNINEEDENENENNFEMENEIHSQQHNSNFIQEEEQEFEQDDVYMIELHRKLGMMKQERKLAEKDSQLLFNRLRLLKNEEEKVI